MMGALRTIWVLGSNSTGEVTAGAPNAAYAAGFRSIVNCPRDVVLSVPAAGNTVAAPVGPAVARPASVIMAAIEKRRLLNIRSLPCSQDELRGSICEQRRRLEQKCLRLIQYHIARRVETLKNRVLHKILYFIAACWTAGPPGSMR